MQPRKPQQKPKSNITTKSQQNKEANNLPRPKMGRIDHELSLNIVKVQYFIHHLCSCLPRLEWKQGNRLTLWRAAKSCA